MNVDKKGNTIALVVKIVLVSVGTGVVLYRKYKRRNYSNQTRRGS